MAFLDCFTKSQKLADVCEFQEKDNVIQDNIVFSVADRELKEKLLEADDLTLEKAKEKCLAAEITRKEVKEMTGSTKAVNTMNRPRRSQKKPQSSDAKKNTNKTSRTSQQKSSGNCGKKHPPRQCPAYGRECLIGNKTILPRCVEARRKQQQQLPVTSLTRKNLEFFSSVQSSRLTAQASLKTYGGRSSSQKTAQR